MGFTSILSAKERVSLGWLLIILFFAYIIFNTGMITMRLIRQFKCVYKKYKDENMKRRLKLEWQKFVIKMRRCFIAKGKRNRDEMDFIDIDIIEVIDDPIDVDFESDKDKRCH